ncbi:GNAT family N-acetyltransferase [Thalassotalea sp. M1531]|uniref:GNAT family N-acetyltransferase n=1 Tax=Thalassotalea algicola TaxID=2716224 RepID=A0A7Y0LFD3_9GAMM|nr:GNAT family N-acetyltransferase [Thalassotalea algicola]NMP32155.1 GNAT family N-acetyltransferase [Thalassotalea algicola]
MKVTDSARLSYRLLDEHDADLFYTLDRDPEVMRFINGGKPHTLEYIKSEAIPRLMAYTDQVKGHGMWGVFIKESNEFIGWILVRPMNFFSDVPEFDNLEIGWRFMQNSWGKGFGTEAAQQVKDAIVGLGAVSAISAIAVPDNKGSINIMTKIGLTFIKQYIHHDKQLGELEAVYYQQQL